MGVEFYEELDEMLGSARRRPYLQRTYILGYCFDVGLAEANFAETLSPDLNRGVGGQRYTANH